MVFQNLSESVISKVSEFPEVKIPSRLMQGLLPVYLWQSATDNVAKADKFYSAGFDLY